MIVIDSITKSFGSQKVLHGVSATIERGEVVCLIGPSGSGKSTVLRCINGLESYDGGTISIDGVKVDSSARSIREIRRSVSMVFQRFNLFPHRTVLENVIEGPIYVNHVKRDVALGRGRELLDRVGLAAKHDAYPTELSGGQQQRVAIARALAMEPKAILFDEPTSALDPELVGEVLGVMKSLAQEGLTMIVVTHEMGFARAVSDRTLFLEKGMIVAQGTSREILSNPSNERMQDFLRRVSHE
ncbi:amino acid ABC transporter ATP-binding protein [Pseudomonas kuykendallii]|uniref:Glutamine ABC transporter ATP-binding protein n=2 Tax=Pseudomonas TaxID=286 RepID=A0A2W5D1Y9_9PSED|nr:amino acid ABC transporter ATP-binding protein [Pseudomonas kuykendallii]PZP25741.1 MAG: glutamine ABC transporter ATP-binding protein [Pseudomonas kuykendallii]